MVAAPAHRPPNSAGLRHAFSTLRGNSCLQRQLALTCRQSAATALDVGTAVFALARRGDFSVAVINGTFTATPARAGTPTGCTGVMVRHFIVSRMGLAVHRGTALRRKNSKLCEDARGISLRFSLVNRQTGVGGFHRRDFVRSRLSGRRTATHPGARSFIGRLAHFGERLFGRRSSWFTSASP